VALYTNRPVSVLKRRVAIAERQLQEFRDYRDICDLLARYGVALDRRDWPAVATCFSPSLQAEYSGSGNFASYVQWEAMARAALDRCLSTQHLVGNIRVDLDGDSAKAQSYAQAMHVMRSGEQAVTGTAYDDVLVRSKGGWRIEYRKMTRLWGHGPNQVPLDEK